MEIKSQALKYKAVIFDLDGTLYDNSVLKFLIPIYNIGHIRLIEAERSARKKMAGLWKGSKEEVFRTMFSMISARTGVSAEEVEQWYRNSYMPSMVAIVRKFCHKRYWVDKMLADLRHDGCKLVCFSDYDFVCDKLKALQVNPSAFDFIIDAARAGGFKPCRESFAAIADTLGIPAEEILVVGDREDTDGAGALDSGMQFLKVPEELDTLLNLV